VTNAALLIQILLSSGCLKWLWLWCHCLDVSCQ